MLNRPSGLWKNLYNEVGYEANVPEGGVGNDGKCAGRLVGPWIEALMSAEHSEFDEPEADGQVSESESGEHAAHQTVTISSALGSSRKYVAYTIKLPSEQLAALQSIWLELKRLYGAHSPDKSGMIQQAIAEWLKRWDGPERQELLSDLLQIREDTRRRQYRK